MGIVAGKEQIIAEGTYAYHAFHQRAASAHDASKNRPNSADKVIDDASENFMKKLGLRYGSDIEPLLHSSPAISDEDRLILEDMADFYEYHKVAENYIYFKALVQKFWNIHFTTTQPLPHLLPVLLYLLDGRYHPTGIFIKLVKFVQQNVANDFNPHVLDNHIPSRSWMGSAKLNETILFREYLPFGDAGLSADTMTNIRQQEAQYDLDQILYHTSITNQEIYHIWLYHKCYLSHNAEQFQFLKPMVTKFEGMDRPDVDVMMSVMVYLIQTKSNSAPGIYGSVFSFVMNQSQPPHLPVRTKAFVLDPRVTAAIAATAAAVLAGGAYHILSRKGKRRKPQSTRRGLAKPLPTTTTQHKQHQSKY